MNIGRWATQRALVRRPTRDAVKERRIAPQPPNPYGSISVDNRQQDTMDEHEREIASLERQLLHLEEAAVRAASVGETHKVSSIHEEMEHVRRRLAHLRQEHRAEQQG